jgi:NADPH-dependent glutamate synthase beta subunit-like oxidoreductase/2,4-dienoyl-CoA reductase-like NADH-dependent reductase (Old Yellow Enzyme family)
MRTRSLSLRSIEGINAQHPLEACSSMEIPHYQPFYLQSLADLRAELTRLGLDAPIQEDLAPLNYSLKLGSRIISNRFCAQPISGADAMPDGSPGPLTVRRYHRYAKGAFGLIWMERTAAVEMQVAGGLCLSESTMVRFASMLEHMRADSPARATVLLQLTSKIPSAIVSAAKLAYEAGYDGVDIQTERETLPETISRLKSAVPELLIGTRICAYEAIRGGFGVSTSDYRKFDLSAPLAFVDELVKRGLQILNLTSANPRLTGANRGTEGIPDYQPGDEHPLTTLVRQLEIARFFRKEFPSIVIVGSGLSWLRQLLPHIAAGAVRAEWMDFAGLGRSALACPDLPAQVLAKGSVTPTSTCMVCFACTQLSENSREVGCILRDAETYGNHFLEMRSLAPDRLHSEAARCHLCEAAPCTEKSPTRTNIASFIKNFRESREEDAFALLRASNPLPEITAQTSAYWMEEEGACIENFLSGRPVPIHYLQYAVAWHARARGLSGVHIPTACTEKLVAIIGGGPTGISAATRLIELGHRAHIFETSSHLGGVPARLLAKRRAITNPIDEIDALLNPALREGRLQIFYNATLGKNLYLNELLSRYHSVLVAIGLWSERSLGRAGGVIGALDFLEHGLTSTPRRVAVLAGGDTAMDVCSGLRSIGVANIHVVFPGPRSALHWHMSDGWFAHPGVHAMMNWQPLGYECDDNEQVTGLLLRHSELGAEVVQPVDLVVEAMNLEVPADLHSELKIYSGRVHAAGALMNGGASVGRCIADGRAKAEAIHLELSK